MADVRPRSRRAPTIRRFVSAALVVPIVLLTIGLLIVSTIAAGATAESFGRSALETATARVESDLSEYLKQAERLSAFTIGLLIEQESIRGDAEILPLLTEQIRLFPVATAAYVARPDGSLVGATRDPGGIVTLHAAGGTMTESTGPDARDPAALVRSYAFDPRTRPWYEQAASALGPIWVPPYSYVRRGIAGYEVGTSYARALRPTEIEGAEGRLLGVFSIDVAFGELDQHLRQNPLATIGRLLVVDDEGLLVAASDEVVADESGGRRALPAPFRPLFERRATGAESPAQLIVVDAEPMWSSVTRLADSRGTRWYVIAAIPEAAMLAAARPVQAWLIGLSLAALLAAVLASLWLARRVSDPIQALQAHVRGLGQGTFSARLDLRAARELEDLSRDLNDMSAALKERMALQQSMAFARQVQQTLLPPLAHSRPGFELLGRADYADGAGGDYFDYLELPGRDALLIAIGDVMGHGVASAILMATARTALRSEVRRAESLGAILVRVNQALLQNRGHGRFMTMFLLVVEPARGRIRWANAGHESGLVIPAGGGACVTLEGGDLPLGIDPGVVYLEQSMELAPGALMFVGTDGIKDTANSANEAFGQTRLEEALLRRATAPLATIADGLVAEVETFRGAERVRDDLTFVVGRVE